ncbi:MAG: DUF5939 domain-containing protein [Amaricoccus sp.]
MLNEELIDRRLARLEAARAWSPRTVAKIENHIRFASDEALFRINPFAYAEERGLGAGEAIDLFLHGVACGLFQMDWHLLCPRCACVVESFSSLRRIDNRYRCPTCQSEYEAQLDDLIAVTFTVSPDLREIVFHHPERLSAYDRFFKLGGTRDGRLPDGTPFIDAQASMTHAVVDLPPGTVTEVEVEATEGAVLGVALEGRVAVLFPIGGRPVTVPQCFRAVFGEKVLKNLARPAAPGPLRIAVENVTDIVGTFCVATLPPGFQVGHATLAFAPFLSGKRLITTQTYRDLFQGEVIRSGAGIGVRDITLLFTDLKGTTALYERIGDLNAFALVQRHFDRLEAVIARHEGTVVKTIGDAVMAAFGNTGSATRAAIEMLRDIEALNQGLTERALSLKIGLHRGAAVVVTQNDRLDYFGQSVNVAARVQALAEGDEIFLSREVRGSPEVPDILLAAGFEIDVRHAQIRGLARDLPVYRVRAAAR